MAGECFSHLTERDGEAGRVADQALEEQVGATPMVLIGETEASNSSKEICNMATKEQDFLLPSMLQMVHINSIFS